MTALFAAALAATAADVERLLDEWDVAGAERAAAEIERTAPDDPRTAYAVGLLRFSQGRYPEAVERLAEAVTGAPHEDEWKAYLALATSVADATRALSAHETAGGHFVVHVAPGKDEWLVPYVGEALEAQRGALEQDLGFAPPEKVRVEVFSEVADLARVSMLTAGEIETSGVVALCKWNRLMIVSPRALLRGYPWLDTAAHEYTHYVVSRLTRDRVPIWLHEGIAKRKEERWRRADDGRAPLAPAVEGLLAEALEKGRLIPFERLHPSIAKLPSQKDATVAFAEVATMVEHVEKLGGAGALRQLLEAVRDGDDADRAVASLTRRSFAALQGSWKEWLGRRGLARRPNVAPLGLAFRARGKDGGRRADPDPSRLADERASRHARLGAMLEERARPRAAVVEYEKALAAARAPAPLVSARLARLYLDMGDATRALAAARATSDAYPDLAGARVAAGEALLRLGRSVEAAPEFEAANAVSPFDPRVHCGLAEAWRATGDARAERESRACAALR